jgi:hypothetical protein
MLVVDQERPLLPHSGRRKLVLSMARPFTLESVRRGGGAGGRENDEERY